MLNNAADFNKLMFNKYEEIKSIREHKKNVKSLIKNSIFFILFGYNIYFSYQKLILGKYKNIRIISVLIFTSAFALSLNYGLQYTINKYYRQRMRDNLTNA